VQAETSVDRSRENRCIAVRIRDGLYGLMVEEVQEVIGMRPVTKVFHSADAIFGVTSLRGEVLPVIDVGVLLGGLPAEAASQSARIVVVREPGERRRRAGLLIDALGGLRELPSGGLLEVPSTASEAVRDLVVGVIGTPPPCSVLSTTAVFDAPVLNAFAGEGADE
jgi:purine-binding chemotaxis protein CheW